MHADPREPRLAELLATLGEASSSFLVGGLASSRSAFGQVAGEITEGGLSGLLVSGEVSVATGLTQGCSPVGPPRQVTSSEQNILIELDGRPVACNRKEFDLLAYLATNVGVVVERAELYAHVWREPYGGADKTIDVHLSWLRRKLGETAADPRYLHTVRGVGVKLVDPGN